MDEEFINLLADISALSVIIPIFLGLIKFRNRPKYLKILGFLVAIAGISDLISRFFVSILNPTANLFTIIQFLLLIIIYHHQINSEKKKYYIRILVQAYVIYAFINLLLVEGFYNRNTNLRTVSSIVFIILSVYYFFQLIEKQPVPNILKYPMFWVNSAILVYFSGNLFLFASNNILSSEQIYIYYYLIHNILNVVKNLLFGIAFLMPLVYYKDLEYRPEP